MNTLNWKIPIAVAVVAVCIVAIYTILQREEKEKEKEKSYASTQIYINDQKIEKNELISTSKKKIKKFGQQQSPINIISKSDDNNMNKVKLTNIDNKEFHANPLKILYPKQVKDCTIINNGHTVQINIPKHNNCTLTIHGKTYLLKQFHFHIPSEHQIDGKQYEMEMHLVHINEKNEIAVLGMIFTKKQKHFVAKLKKSRSGMHLTLKNNSKKNKDAKKTKNNNNDDDEKNDFLKVTTDDDTDWSDDDDSKDNDQEIGNEFLDQFWEQLPTKKTEKNINLKKSISFDYLFEESSSIGTFSKEIKTNEIIVDMELFEYIGSLTTPPYTEGVQWLLSKKLHHINQNEINQLSACWGFKNNARNIQQIHGRMVSFRSLASVTKSNDQ